MVGLAASEVAARLGLSTEYSSWLDMLEALGAPAGGLADPGDLDTVGIDQVDRPDIRETLATSEAVAEWQWLLERAYHAVKTDIGDTEGLRPMPNLPLELGAHGRCFWIAVLLYAVPDIRRWHHAHSVSDEISTETLSDLGRHIRLYRGRTGHSGLDTQWWLSLHFRGGLFGIGRLQYAPYHLLTGPAGPLFWYEASTDPAFQRGAPAIGLHIPEAGPLAPQVCSDSFRNAHAFFAQAFPEYAQAVVTCTSWLLDEQLAEYLDDDSNIVSFQRRFELAPGWRESDVSAFHFVFGKTPADIDALEPRTTLERAIVEHVRAGRHWGMRTGWLRLADQL